MIKGVTKNVEMKWVVEESLLSRGSDAPMSS